MKRNWVKRALWSLTGLVGLIVLVIALAKVFFPAERVRQLVQAQAGQALGREVTIGGVGFSILHGFAVDLRDFRIAAADWEQEIPYLLQGERLLLRVKLLPLLRRRIEVDHLQLVRPEVYLVRAADGALNVARLLEPKGEEAPPAAEESEPLELLFSYLGIEAGRLHYLDRALPARLAIGPIGLELRLDQAGSGGRKLRGELKIDSLQAEQPLYLQNLEAALPFELKLAGIAGNDMKNFEFEHVELFLAGLEFKGQGKLEGLGAEAGPTYAFKLAGGADDLGELVQYLPDSLKQGPRAIKAVGGSLEAELSAFSTAAPAGSDSAANGFGYTFDGVLDDVSLTLASLPEGFSDVAGNLSLRTGELVVPKLEGKLGAGRFSLSGRIGLEGERLPLTGRLTLKTQAPQLVAFFPEPDQWEAAGELEADLALGGDLSNPPYSVMATGTLTAKKLRLAATDGSLVLDVPSLSARLVGDDIESFELRLAGDHTSLKAEGSLRNFYALAPEESRAPGQAPLDWRLALTGESLDLRDILPERAGGEDGQAPSAEEEFELPMDLGTGRAEARLERFVYNDFLKFDDLEALLTANGRTVRVERLRGSFYSGELTGSGNFSFPKGAAPIYHLDLKANAIRPGEAFASLTSFAQYLSGQLSTDLSLSGSSFKKEDLFRSLTGQGSFNMSQAELNNPPLLLALSEAAKLNELKEVSIRGGKGSFSIDAGQVLTRAIKLQSPLGEWTADGAFGFDGNLNYKIDLQLSPELSQRYRSLVGGELAALMADRQGRVRLPFSVSGLVGAPRVRLATDELQAQARRNVAGKAQEQVEKLGDRLLGRLGGARPDTAAADSAGVDTAGQDARRQLREKAGDALKNLFKRKPQNPPAPPADTTPQN